ncbi:MAG: thioredoxin [Patescibacteria group bacterium]
MGKGGVKLLDFWAAWCGPCKIMNPILEEIEKEYGSKITVVKYDVDDATNQEIVQKYQVMAMPTYFIEKDGQVVGQFVGAQSKSTLTKALDQALG